MTAKGTPVPAEAAPAVRSDLRILPIVANLLPAEVVDARRQRKVRKTTIALLAGFVVLLLGWYGQAWYETSNARDRLARAQDNVQLAMAQQRAFAEIVTAQGESQRITTQLRSLLANDLQWSDLMVSLQAVAPEGVLITGVFGLLIVAEPTGPTGGTAGGTAPAATGDSAQAASGTEPQATPGAAGDPAMGAKVSAWKTGSLTVTGSAPDELAAAAYVDALGTVVGLANPFLGDAVRQDGTLRFTIRIDIMSSALGGRYATKKANGTGGG